MVEMAGAFVPAHQPADDLAVDEGGRRKVDHELRAVGDDPFHLIFQPGHRRHIVFAVNREHPRIALADEPGGSALRERRPLDFCQIRHTPLVMALHDPPSDRKPQQKTRLWSQIGAWRGMGRAHNDATMNRPSTQPTGLSRDSLNL